MMRNLKLVMLLFFLSICLGVQAQEQDRLLQLLKSELQVTLDELNKQDLPPYYLNFRAMDEYNVNISSSFGALSGSNAVRVRRLVPHVRLGSPELDNFKYNSQGVAANRRGGMPQGVLLPLSNEFSDAVREAIWRETLKRYNFARTQLEASRTKATVSVEDEDKSNCFSKAPVEKYYEAPIENVENLVDVKAWEMRLNEISATFKSCPELQNGSASLTFQVYRTYFVNSEGTEVVQNRVAARLMLGASLKAADGMELPLNKDYFAYQVENLPSNEVIIADAKDMIRRLLALREAPVADPYTGPAVLSGPASGIFFHEIFGHRLEGHRMKPGGQTFKKMVGDQILPADFQVYCDPTLARYANTDMNGYYLYDDEGVKARRVDNVVDGVLKEFLMSRIPLEAFPQSNGHGRAIGGFDPVSRQSNLVIETTRPRTEAELRTLLIEEAKKQGKEYGYYFNTVTSGFTFLGDGGSMNSFNVTPLEVYRVYVDGRPDELVRGVDMIGTPLSMFSNISAGGDQPVVFTGMCGAESGWVPVTACSPMLYVSKIETQRRAQSRDLPRLLPAPELKGNASVENDEVIFSALEDELQRNKALSLPGNPSPYYISYTLSRFRQFQVVGSLGGVTYSMESPWMMHGGVQVMLGNYQRNSDLEYINKILSVKLPSDVDYDGIRRAYWTATDNMYRYALQCLQQKTVYLQQNPLPAEETAVADMQQLPAVKHEITRAYSFEYDLEKLKDLVSELSGVFAEYKDLYNTSIQVSGCLSDVYRLTSEDIRLKQPNGVISINMSASVRTIDGINLNHKSSITELNPSDLPEMEELKTRVKNFAEELLKLRDATPMEEYYLGPVLFEGGASARIFMDDLLPQGRLLAQRTLTPQRGMLDEQLGRKIMDTRISIKNYTNLKEYNGTRLFGHYEMDGDGVTPMGELSLVENGIFKRQLNTRYPTRKAPESTGSARFLLNPTTPTAIVGPGTIHVSVEKGLSSSKLKKALLKLAKEEGLEYAYIVRSISGETSEIYRVNVKDGKETRVRSVSFKVPELTKLMDLGGISSEEKVMNFMPNGVAASMIYPSGIIVKNIELNKSTPKIEKAPALTHPFKR